MSGQITVIIGPMFSEKTGEMIDRCIKLQKLGGKTVKIYKPAEDKRFSQNEVVSRIGLRYPATNIPKAMSEEVTDRVLKETKSIDVVGFDEVQFFEKPIMRLVEELAYRGKHVIANGLNMDYRGKEFGYIGGLLAMADEIIQLTAYCAVCRSPNAMFTQRIIRGKPANSGPIMMIGDSESYEPRCRRCFVPPHRAS